MPSRTLPGDPTKSAIPDWARRRGVLPVHVTIKHEFERLIHTAKHPNSENLTLADQLVNSEQSGQTTLYVVYRNQPENREGENAAPHRGCCELQLKKSAETRSARPAWRLKGDYWTDKPRSANDHLDRGTWGDCEIHYESRSLGEEKIDWENEERFASQGSTSKHEERATDFVVVDSPKDARSTSSRKMNSGDQGE
jgi:hypothetical protein